MTQHDALDQLQVASPCNARWEEMTGDDRVRFCGLCQLHVYNFSEMNREEVASLIQQAEGKICGRLYRREDGTLLTRDCPKGLQAVRLKVLKVASLLAGAMIGLFSTAGIGLARDKAGCEIPIQGDVSVQAQPAFPLAEGLNPDSKPLPTMGSVVQVYETPEPPVMGEMMLPKETRNPSEEESTPQQTPESQPLEQTIMGKIQMPQPTQNGPHP